MPNCVFVNFNFSRISLDPAIFSTVMELSTDYGDRMEKGKIMTYSGNEATATMGSKDPISSECSPSTGEATEKSEARFSNMILNCFSVFRKKGIASEAELLPRKPVVRTCTDPPDKAKNNHGSLTIQQ
jgi:hypothetical protein